MHPDLKRLSDLLRAAVAAELGAHEHRPETHAKADGSVVTAVDAALQDHLRRALDREWPGIPLLGEEMTAAEQGRLLDASAEGIWVLDPLDGTSNFVGGFPAYALSLALIRGGAPVLGAVLDPRRDECFCARRDGGAWCNGEPMAPYAPGLELGDCLAMIDFKRLPPARIAPLFRPGGFRSQRNLGAAALEWCWLAAGRFQLYLHGGQKLWDYAAGHLIATEAGAPSRAYRPYGTAPAAGLDLAPRLFVAAATEALLEQWLDFVDLPLDRPAEAMWSAKNASERE